MMNQEPSLDPVQLRRAFACFPSGVVAVCSLYEGTAIGMAVSAFTPISLDPPLVSVCMAHTSTTWPVLRHQERLGISVLAEHHDIECRTLSTKNGNRFAGVNWNTSKNGAVYIDEASLTMECQLYEEIEAGDHKIALLQVLSQRATPEMEPLVFHTSNFRKLAPSHCN